MKNFTSINPQVSVDHGSFALLKATHLFLKKFTVSNVEAVKALTKLTGVYGKNKEKGCKMVDKWRVIWNKSANDKMRRTRAYTTREQAERIACHLVDDGMNVFKIKRSKENV